ncbi:MAG TPA: phenylalanine 4-monooxygenase [Micropepsaceae bacterium]|nr:phenylalanine 4-monooxygenase [Micropepsaceae bacterium]
MEPEPTKTGEAAFKPARSSHALRGDYAGIRSDFTVDQPLDHYAPEDHDRWRRLYDQQIELMPRYAVKEYLESLELLDISDGTPDLERISRHLKRLTGFELVAVPGLIPDEAFFKHLANRRFPVTWWIREEAELDYLEEPDIFHDLFGHIPLLAHPVFADYMVEYGKAGPNAARMNAIPLLSRLYWYTIEFGLIRTSDGLRAYGSGILSSHGETIYAIDSPVPNRLGFDLERVLATEFCIDAYQETYFVIDSFEQLFAETQKPFAPLYERIKLLKPHPAYAVLDSDRVLHKGQLAASV